MVNEVIGILLDIISSIQKKKKEKKLPLGQSSYLKPGLQ
jgi:hypothetical protein